MTPAEKALQLKQDFDEVYASGYEKGLSEGGGGSDDGVLASLINRSIMEVNIPHGVTVLGDCAFRGCQELKKVTLPNSLKRIEAMAFYLIKSLEEIEIPEGVEFIGGSVFSGCSNLARVTVPESVTAIGSTAFNGTAIPKFTFPDKVERIDDRIFLGCQNLVEIVMPSACKYVEEFAFGNCTSCLVYDFSKCLTVPKLFDANAFQSINAEAKILVPASLYNDWIVATNWSAVAEHIVFVFEDYFPEEVSEGLEYSNVDKFGFTNGGYYVLGRGSFEGEELVIPEEYNGLAVKDIYFAAFSNDDKTTLLYVPPSIAGIDNETFCNCPNLRKIYLPGVSSVASLAFMGLTALKYVKFGSSISWIGDESFRGCDGVIYDFSECTAVPTLNITNTTALGTDPIICVPASLYNKWIVATNWSMYADYIEPIEPHYSVSVGLEYETDNYGNISVVGRGSCTDSVIVIPNRITAIAGGAFANDTMIDTLVLPESGVTIECRPSDGLGGVEGSSLRKIVNYYHAEGVAFSGLSLEYISFVETPREIDGLVFYGIQGSPVYDFSKCTAVVQFSSDVKYMSVGEDTQIIVPASLYDEWVSDTNWAYYVDYIVPYPLTAPTIEISNTTLNIYDEEGIATSYDILVDGEVKATVEKGE